MGKHTTDYYAEPLEAFPESGILFQKFYALSIPEHLQTLLTKIFIMFYENFHIIYVHQNVYATTRSYTKRTAAGREEAVCVLFFFK